MPWTRLHSGVDDRDDSHSSHARINASWVREPAGVTREDAVAVHVIDVEAEDVERDAPAAELATISTSSPALAWLQRLWW